MAVKSKLEFLSYADNVFDFPQATISANKVSSEDVEKLSDNIKIYLPKAKNHFMYELIHSAYDKQFSHFEFVKLNYVLPSAFNKKTNKIVVNVNAFDKKDLSNIQSSDLYAVLCYGYTNLYYTLQSIDVNIQQQVCDYMSSLFIKIFAKRYGLIGSYTYELPKLRFIITYYVLVSFFNYSHNDSYALASNYSGIKITDVDFSQYNFKSIKQLIKFLSDSSVFHGINDYTFASTIIKSFGVIMLPLFEDSMRFMSSLVGTSVASNNMFPVYFQRLNLKVYNRILDNIKSKLT